jgi:hypothetical protein
LPALKKKTLRPCKSEEHFFAETLARYLNVAGRKKSAAGVAGVTLSVK